MKHPLRASKKHGRVSLVSKELPATSDNSCQPPSEGGDYVFRLDVAKLLEAAKAHGDDTQAKISRRTGIAESSVSRYLRGEAQPDLNCAMRLSEAYDIDLRTAIKRVPLEAAA
jgi:ribosome-binding protein aMBF1 (putative translation factor)